VKLEKEYYLQNDVVKLGKNLLGKFLCTNIDGVYRSGMITETEAYRAPQDKASHAYGGKRTARTEVFFEEGGVAYVYLCYGIHHLFNIVTNQKDVPHAILLRSIEPVDGIDAMLQRRGQKIVHPTLCCGPGSMSKALGIDMRHNKASLMGAEVWLEDRGILIKEKDILKGPRIGINYAEEYVLKPWRFGIKDSKWVSKKFD
jgi:DNA-3-methyladenine glycosylase